MDVAIGVHEEAGMGVVDTCWENDIIDMLVLILGGGSSKAKFSKLAPCPIHPLGAAENWRVRVSPLPGSSAGGSTSPDS